VTGPRGAEGPVGPMGAPGAPGAPGAGGSRDIITRTILCTANDPVLLISVSAYIWVIDAAADMNDNIGICSISEAISRHTATTPMIGSVCNLPSLDAGGVITLDFSMNPPVIGGASSGTMACL
jgi:hypothetical protein